MTEISDFGQIILVVAAGFTLALFARALGDRARIPGAALFLVAAAAASDLFPELRDALIVILFDGGLDSDRRSVQSAVRRPLQVAVQRPGGSARGSPRLS